MAQFYVAIAAGFHRINCAIKGWHVREDRKRRKLRVVADALALLLCCLASFPAIGWGIAHVWAINCRGDSGFRGPGLHAAASACGITAMVAVLVIGAVMFAGMFVARAIALWSLDRWDALDKPEHEDRPTLKSVK